MIKPQQVGKQLTLSDKSANYTLTTAEISKVRLVTFLQTTTGIQFAFDPPEDTNSFYMFDIVNSGTTNVYLSSISYMLDANAIVRVAYTAGGWMAMPSGFPTTEEFAAVADQTSFTLLHRALGTVSVFRNGVRLPKDSITVADNVLTYVPANNSDVAMVVDDRITIDYTR